MKKFLFLLLILIVSLSGCNIEVGSKDSILDENKTPSDLIPTKPAPTPVVPDDNPTVPEQTPTVPHNHLFESVSYDETYHWSVCECGEITEKVEHIFSNQIVIKEPTTTEEGEKLLGCDCGYSYSEVMEKLPEVDNPTPPDNPSVPHNHSFTGVYDETYHWDVCECGEISEKVDHVFSNQIVIKEPTTAEEGQRLLGCECGYSYSEVIDKIPLPTVPEEPIDISGITFNSIVVEYDGTKHSIQCENIPDGVMIDYVGNYVVEVGTYKVEAIIYDFDYVELGRLEATITITAQTYSIKAPNLETRKINSIEEVSADDFFNLGNTIDIEVTISDSELNKLQKDYETGHKSEIYRLASKVVIKMTNYGTTFTWEFENVGIRQKGNTSRRSIFDGDNLNKNHYKLSFDETFDDTQMYDSSFISKYGNQGYKNRDFLGLSGLDFKWDKNYDSTHIREIYANYMYRAAGILAQRSGLSTFSLVRSDKNNKKSSMGLCTVYEPSSKSFIKHSLKDGNEYINMGDWDTEKSGTFGVEGEKYGDLYKCSYGTANKAPILTNITGNVGVGNISGSYVPLYDRKTNKDVDYDDELIKKAEAAIKSGDYNEIAKYVDLEYLAVCEAVGYVVGNPDSMRYNSNNYMVYMRRTDGKMVFIPIDNDRCFGITKDWNVNNGLKSVGMLDRKNSNGKDTVSLLLNTVLSKSDNPTKTLYVEFCNTIKNSAWGSVSTFEQYFEKAKASYPNYSFSLNNTDNNMRFSEYMNSKMNQITPLEGSGSGDNNNQGSTEEDVNIYLVSTINNWGDYSSSELSKYKLVKIADNTYSITVTITKLESDGNYFKFKFNGGYNDYSQLDWTLNSDLTKLVKSQGSSARCYGVKIGDVVTITINTKTLEASVVIN